MSASSTPAVAAGASDAPQQVLQAAHALAAAGDHVAAFARVEQLLARLPAGEPLAAAATALTAVARAAERCGDGSCARRALEAALALVDWADLHVALGTLLVRDGERGEARQHFMRALAINPRYRAAVVELALLDAREGRIGDAVSALRALTGGEPAHESESLQRGLERLRVAEVEDAAPLLRRALTGCDEALEAWLAQAQRCFAAGDPAGGLRHLQRAVAERPSYADVHAMLGSYELRAGRLDDGIASLVYALELNPEFHLARLELARGLEARGERDAALLELEQLLEVEPSHADAATFRDRLTSRRRPPAPAGDERAKFLDHDRGRGQG